MVGRALSERVKRQSSRRVKNAQMQMAIDEYRREVLREGGTAAKNLPKKPKRVLKASLVEEDEDESEGGGSDEASDSDDEW